MTEQQRAARAEAAAATPGGRFVGRGGGRRYVLYSRREAAMADLDAADEAVPVMAVEEHEALVKSYVDELTSFCTNRTQERDQVRARHEAFVAKVRHAAIRVDARLGFCIICGGTWLEETPERHDPDCPLAGTEPKS